MAVTANEIDRHVGQRLRLRREALSLSQGRLGQHLGLTFSQVQKYEKGANRIGAGRLFMLSEVLHVPIQYFYEGLPGTAQETFGSTQNADVTALGDAFLSISDASTRRSVLALVCALAGPDAKPAPGDAGPGAGVAGDTVRPFRRPGRGSAPANGGPTTTRASS